MTSVAGLLGPADRARLAAALVEDETLRTTVLGCLGSLAGTTTEAQ